MKKTNVNKTTGEVTEGTLNEIVRINTVRKNGSRRRQLDFQFCPTMAEQHTAHLSDINYLIEKYKPDELDAYLAARSQHRQEIVGHDFSKELDLQDAKNVVYQSRQAFEALDENLKSQFKNHVEFLKFIDNPANAEKMLKLGLLVKEDLNKLLIPEPVAQPAPITPTTKEEKEAGKN